MLVPKPWQAAFGQAKPYKIGTLQPLSGAGAAGGKTALVGVQMAADRINKLGGINGRPIELVVADDESKPDVGRRKLPDGYVQSNYEAMNALKLAMEKSKFHAREDTMKLIEALEGLEMKESDDFPQGDKVLRKEDHQAFLREFIFDIKGGKHRIVEVVPKEKTIVPPACKFAPS